MFAKRMKEEKPIHLPEFLYPLMQGYDSVAFDIDLEIGGNDQTFNMLAGRTLQRKYNDKEKFVIATTLIVNPATGKKIMSKSEGNYVSLRDNAQNMFGKIMALPDEVIMQMFVDCTRLSMQIIGEMALLNPRDQKIALAKEIVKMYHGVAAAEKAEKNFVAVFSNKEIPNNIQEITVEPEALLAEAFVSAGIVQSKTEFSTLVGQGAITNLDTGEKVSDIRGQAKSATYRIGKHRFLKIK
jgi:tyrosyl-tRNA synthetase